MFITAFFKLYHAISTDKYGADDMCEEQLLKMRRYVPQDACYVINVRESIEV